MQNNFMMDQNIIYALILFTFFFILRKLYHVRESVSGETLMKIDPAGRKGTEIQIFVLLLMLWIGFFVFRIGERLSIEMFADRGRGAMMVFGAVLLGGWIVFSMLPIKICEKGIVSQKGFYPWEKLRAYRFKDADTFELIKKSGPTDTFYFAPKQRSELEALLRSFIVLDGGNIPRGVERSSHKNIL